MVLLGVLILIQAVKADSSIVMGWLETVSIEIGAEQHTIKAKIDTGADHSSLHAIHIKLFSQQGQAWVQFLAFGNRTFELPVYRTARIKTKNNELQERPVVQLMLCLNGQKRRVDVNLVDRSRFSRPLLIGRSALSGFLINPSQTNLLAQSIC